MALTAGIVGLPNVGKSTLFCAITKAGAEIANYPFCTIEPNVGSVLVPDDRLDQLVKIIKPIKKIPTTFEFTDIAGIVKGASKGEGLGNKFLAHIRNVDAICHVVRCFIDDNITHVSGKVDALGDIEIINTELILADLEAVEKRIVKVKKLASQKEQTAMEEYDVLQILLNSLQEEKPARLIEWSNDQLIYVKNMHLLTMKPVLYVANIAETEISNISNNVYVEQVKNYAKLEKSEVITLCAKLESELVELSGDERNLFLEESGILESGLDQLIRKSYYLLDLATYFTAGEKEVRAWTFKKGMKAPECAGIIHSDFERGFIRAETVSYDNLILYGSMQAAKDSGKVRSEGKLYEVKDGDVLLFRFNV